jgi:predicted transposase/invertase (TIGR01784 family)
MRQKAWRDRASQNDGFYQNGIKAGRLEGLLEGRLEGLQEGKLEGLQEGKLEGQRDVARKALAAGMALEVISEITGLDAETIKGLAGQ